ncbi:PREDICTED: uncharacterized protein LOC105575271 [Cercocebus atys]|uniref:uncharacterized protein LOC105575271 n=1 Tax=Cercocebus atys TaxID=9531 RepID=UPI0005F40C9E|nr:PREDICTED: uncharacterized protein LOC105575271 [Cercocebus atys]
MADEHQEGTSMRFHSRNLTMDTLVIKGLVSPQGTVREQRPHHHSGGAGAAGTGPFCEPAASPGCVNGLSCQNSQNISISTETSQEKRTNTSQGLQLRDPQTSTTAPALPRISSSMTLRLKKTAAPAHPCTKLTLDTSSGSSAGPPPPQVSSCRALKREYQLLPGCQAARPSN